MRKNKISSVYAFFLVAASIPKIIVMQQKLILQIPTPCHEKWDNMDTLNQNQPGRFCGSCQKNVVDFTNMSDAQVLAHFSNYQGNTCGRFENDQLNRVLATPPPPKKTWYKWLMAALVSGFIFSNKAKAQTKEKVGEVQVCTIKPPSIENGVELQGVLGGVQIINPKQKLPKYTLEGFVTEENGNPIYAASVVIKGTKNGVATDRNGKFSISYSDKNTILTLEISYVGYETGHQTVKLSDQINKSDILKITLKPVILEAYVTSGVVAVVRKPKKTNKIIDTLRSILPKIAAPAKDKLIISPNPAKAGGRVNLNLGKAGEYELQLFNLQSTILLSQKINIETDGAKTSLNLPASLAAGEYFVRVICNTSKSQSVGKLIVQ